MTKLLGLAKSAAQDNSPSTAERIFDDAVLTAVEGIMDSGDFSLSFVAISLGWLGTTAEQIELEQDDH